MAGGLPVERFGGGAGRQGLQQQNQGSNPFRAIFRGIHTLCIHTLYIYII